MEFILFDENGLKPSLLNIILLITYYNASSPSPDRNGYPAA